MPNQKEFIFNGQKLALFTKTGVTNTGNKTYDIAIKKAIVAQYCVLRRNPLCNQTKALEVLAEAHKLSPSTIKNWYDKYGDNIVTPGLVKNKPKLQIKPDLIKPTKSESTDMSAALESVAKVVNKTSEKSLSKILEILKALPKVEIMISIVPKDS